MQIAGCGSCLPREAVDNGRAERQRADPISLGRQGTEAVQRWHQPRRKRNGALRGVCPLNSYGAVEVVFRTRVLHEIRASSPEALPSRKAGRVEEMLSTRKGGQGRRDGVCLQLRCKLAQPYAPARSLLSTECLQADVDRKVARWGVGTPRMTVAPSARKVRSLTQQCPDE